LALQEAGGGVSTSDDGNLAGAVVRLKQGNASVPSVTAATSGAYTITDVATGTYTIEVTLDGYDAGTIPLFTVSDANVTGKNLTLAKSAGTTLPADVTGLKGIAGEGQVTLSWTDPEYRGPHQRDGLYLYRKKRGPCGE
jgi:hypothetical protein